MTDTSANNKRIAKNTLFLYVRMGLSMFVSLYTSRVVLQVLGVEDYGIYGVVGGVVAMFEFLNASMSGATARFLTYELGRGDSQQLHKTFCMAFYEHVIIASIVLLVCETVGLWFLNTKLVIPTDRLTAANWVFQLSILSMMLNVTQVPYNASIISHEKMDVYAYVGMANVLLKLLIVYLLDVFLFDKLVFYALLVFCVSLSIAMFYRFYCHRHFSECRLQWLWDYPLLKKMFSFSGWDLYGNLSVTARTQGVNLLLNMFFGPALNAASSIATHVQGAVMNFAANVSTAVKPQIIKYYAQGNYQEMVRLMSNTVRLNYLILMVISIPLMVELPYILHLWLGQVPDYTVSFCALTLIFNFYANMSYTLVTGIHATGKIFRPSIINGTLYLAVVPFTYMAFKFGLDAWCPYLFNVIAVILGMLSNAYTLSMYVEGFSFKKFISKDFIPCIVVFAVCLACCFSLKGVLAESFGRLLLTAVLSSISLGILGYFFLIPRALSKKIISKGTSMLCKRGW